MKFKIYKKDIFQGELSLIATKYMHYVPELMTKLLIDYDRFVVIDIVHYTSDTPYITVPDIIVEAE